MYKLYKVLTLIKGHCFFSQYSCIHCISIRDFMLLIYKNKDDIKNV